MTDADARPMDRHGQARIVLVNHDSPEQEEHEMNGPMTTIARSVQLAVMATPTTSLVEAVAEARRRHGTAASSIDTRVGRMPAPSLSAAGAA